MKFSRNKTTATMIALFLVLTIAATLITFLPTVNAAVNYYHSYVYVAANSDLVGVGQDILFVIWTADMPPDIGEERGLLSSPTGRAGWYDMKMNVTKPDNTTETLTLPYSDPVGSNYISYTPDTAGTYYIQGIFPATWKNTTTRQSFYTAAVSPIAKFTAQEEPVPLWHESPLPTGYWTRPISGASRDWYVLTGNWLGGAANVWPTGGAGGTTSPYGYGSAPESAHILWTKPFWIGGLMDERYGAINYQTEHYQGVSFSPTIILDGKIHYTPRYTTHEGKGYAILDLYTGETLFLDYDAAVPSFGQIYLYESPNQHGGFAYLWNTGGVFWFGMQFGTPIELPEIIQVPRAELVEAGQLPVRTGSVQTINRTATPISTGTVWEMLDACTGKTICYIANVTSGGTAVYGKDGSILRYNTVNLGGTNYLQVWNSSHGTMVSSQIGTGAWQWRPAGGSFGGANTYLGGLAYNYVHDGRDFFTLNVSIPSILGPRNARRNQTGSIQAVREGEYIIIGTAGWNDEQGIAPTWMMALSLERGREGTKLWETTFTPPFASQLLNISAPAMFTGGLTMSGVYPEDGVIMFESVKQLKRWGYSLETGELLWESEPEPQMCYYGMNEVVYQGKLLAYGGFAGTMIAYNITTGEILWTYESKNVGFESPYGNYPMSIDVIADGKIYTSTWEHSYTHPLYRGPNLRCINASDGKEIWSILDFGGGLAIADGMLLSSNSMDNQIYCYGKGPSATTVTASPEVSVHGTSVLIKGTVTDDTPTGRRNTNDLLDFSLKGTPAISDEDMSAWMEYLFMQQAMPADAKGVEVSLDTLDPNGNYVHIGTVTSDITGAYGCLFTPEVPGTYQIIATFAGSKSYGPSQATTYLSVGEAPPATAAPEYPQPIDNTLTIVGTGIAIIIAVAIVGILILRKRP